MIYRVQRGDTARRIAGRFAGDPNRWTEARALNPHIRDWDVLRPGDAIVLPPSWAERLTGTTPPPSSPEIGAVANVAANVAKSATYWLSDEVFRRALALAREIDCDPYDLAAVIHYESGWKPWKENQEGSGATGLIQWLPRFAPVPVERLKKMTADEQFRYVEAWFRTKKGRPRWSAAQVYLCVFNPGRLTTRTTDSTPLYRRDSPDEDERVAYHQNRSLDADGDGVIRVGDLGVIVRRTRASASFAPIAARLAAVASGVQGFATFGLLAAVAVAAGVTAAAIGWPR